MEAVPIQKCKSGNYCYTILSETSTGYLVMTFYLEASIYKFRCTTFQAKHNDYSDRTSGL